jgi:hypothetical protein
MGLDWLDFSFHLEKNPHVTIDIAAAFKEMEQTKTEVPRTLFRLNRYDWQVATLFACIHYHCYRLCPNCKKFSAGKSAIPSCSNCGQPLIQQDLTREQFDDALMAVTGAKVIRDDMWLTRDLNFY